MQVEIDDRAIEATFTASCAIATVDQGPTTLTGGRQYPVEVVCYIIFVLDQQYAAAIESKSLAPFVFLLPMSRSFKAIRAFCV